MAGTGQGATSGDRRTAERVLWRLVEAFHAVVYYAPERSEVYSALGLKGGWMGYFASRSAALGQVPPQVVTACFYGFAPRMVERALPDAWRWTTPPEASAARLVVFDRAARRHLGNRVDGATMRRVAESLTAAVSSLPAAGAPLSAAHQALPAPVESHLRAFWATSALREFRGDAHVAILHGVCLDPAQSNRVMVALGLVPADQRSYRGWTENEWAEAEQSLAARGWLSDEGGITELGVRARAGIENRTDAVASAAWSVLSDDDLASLTADLTRVVEPLVTGGAVPYPNGMGMAPAAETSAAHV